MIKKRERTFRMDVLKPIVYEIYCAYPASIRAGRSEIKTLPNLLEITEEIISNNLFLTDLVEDRLSVADYSYFESLGYHDLMIKVQSGNLQRYNATVSEIQESLYLLNLPIVDGIHPMSGCW